MKKIVLSISGAISFIIFLVLYIVTVHMGNGQLEQQMAAARHLNILGVRTCIATLGEAGALVSTLEEQYVVPAYRVHAVDTVAAGDSFNGALAVAITENKPLGEAVRFANAVAALTVQVNGAIPSLHNRCQVEAFLAERA